MARVPLAQPQVQLQGEHLRSNVQATPDAFGARRGQDIARVGQAADQTSQLLSQNAMRMQERLDRESVRQAFVDYDTRVRTLLYDEKSGYLNRRGRDAMGVTTEAFKTLEETEREVGQNLNDRQRALFNDRVASVKSGHFDSLARFESVEFRKAEEETTTALLGTAAQSAIATVDPNLRATYMQQGEVEIDNLGDMHGMGSAVRQRKKLEFRTMVHKGTIDRMLVDDPSGAREYYKALGDNDIDGAHRGPIEKSLQEGVTRQRGQQEADRIVAATSDPRERVRLAEEVQDPLLRDETVRRVSDAISREESFRRIEQNRAAENAWGYVAQAVAQGQYPMPEQIPGFQQFAAGDGQGAASMMDWLDRKRKGEDTETDQLKFMNFVSAPPEAIARYTPAEIMALQPFMKDTDFNYIRSTWEKAVEAARTPAKLDKVTTVSTAATNAAARFGIGKGGVKDKDQAQRYGAFIVEFKKTVDVERQAKNRELTPTEYEDIGARLAGELYRRERWVLPDQTGPAAFEIMSGLNEDYKVSDIPAEDRGKIEGHLRKAGTPVTTENIKALYRKLLRARIQGAPQ